MPRLLFSCSQEALGRARWDPILCRCPLEYVMSILSGIRKRQLLTGSSSGIHLALGASFWGGWHGHIPLYPLGSLLCRLLSHFGLGSRVEFPPPVSSSSREPEGGLLLGWETPGSCKSVLIGREHPLHAKGGKCPCAFIIGELTAFPKPGKCSTAVDRSGWREEGL